MRNLMLIAALAALAACSDQASAPAGEPNQAAANGPIEAAVAGPLVGTTWTYQRAGKPMEELIDPDGQYIATSGTEHIDHGTYADVGGKACFTSAMNKEGPTCWTGVEPKVGETAQYTSDKGETLAVKRISYVPKTM